MALAVALLGAVWVPLLAKDTIILKPGRGGLGGSLLWRIRPVDVLGSEIIWRRTNTKASQSIEYH